MIHGFALGLGIAVAFILVGSVMRRGLGRTIGGLLKVVFLGATALAAAMVIAVLLFRLIAVGNQPAPQEANARAPAVNWLDGTRRTESRQ
jgi:hypothetical protein